MKKKLIALALMLALCVPAAALGETVVTSFYPIYLFAMNLTDGIDGIEVHNLAAPGTGCLHDYQLSTGDMKALSTADVFLINGAGMESYLSFVFEALPELMVVDASEGIELLPDESGETEYNAHVWLDAGNAQIMVNNLAEGLMAALPQHAGAIAANRDAYTARLGVLDEELTSALAEVPHKDIVTFHEAFPYFARAYGLNVAAVVTGEAENALSAYELTTLIRLIQSLNNPPLFTEPQYSDLAAKTIAAETGAPIWTLDPCVTGPDADVLTYYEDVMHANLETLKAALGE